MGALINAARENIGAMIDERRNALRAAEREAQLKRETIDVTEPRPFPQTGTIHPLYKVQDEMINVFTGMGFDVVRRAGGRARIRTTLNCSTCPRTIPPATRRIPSISTTTCVLRTHTSPVQARTMPTRKPPIRIICPGRVYRADEVDATHSRRCSTRWKAWSSTRASPWAT